jgi:hypothetical protein
MCVAKPHLVLQSRRENTDRLAVQVIQDCCKEQCSDERGLDPEAETRHRDFPHDQELNYPGALGRKSQSNKERKSSTVLTS